MNGRIAVISQPAYLPWLGYFDLIDQSDVFVFLDDVQLDKRSWQTRNRIKTKRGLHWLSVPVRVKGRYHQLISQAEVVQDGHFPQRHLRACEHSYRRAPYFETYYPGLRALLDPPPSGLADLSIALIQWACQVIGIQAQFERSSRLAAQGKRSDLLAEICRKLRADVYLSTMGAHRYLLSERHSFEGRGIQIQLHLYEHPRYGQLFGPFLSHACILDLLFNEGPAALDILRSGRRPTLPLPPAPPLLSAVDVRGQALAESVAKPYIEP